MPNPVNQKKRVPGTFHSHPQFSNRDLQIIFKALFSVKEITEDGEAIIDYTKLQRAIGFENPHTTSQVWNKIKRKLAANAKYIDNIVAQIASTSGSASTQEDIQEDIEEDTQEDPERGDMSGGEKVRNPGGDGLKRKVSRISIVTKAKTDVGNDTDSPSVLKSAPRVAPDEGYEGDEGNDDDAGGPAERAIKKARKSLPKKKSSTRKPSRKGKEIEVVEEGGYGSEVAIHKPKKSIYEPRDPVYHADDSTIDPKLLQFDNNEDDDVNVDVEAGIQDNIKQAEDEQDTVFNVDRQRNFDNSFGNDAGDMFGSAPLPPLPPPGYAFGMGVYNNNDDDEDPSFKLFFQAP
ncbi:hypothetical protein O1611_g7066 [Lasiodiplodia mahajangana]|uniref:Uncharacterized protein n=1 Tax=Lasiodiplodia mahajangana TaxID=1108764 RepID=A0ACC2JGS4_9PEZI|nr:hypothetical protein O1611_g7066 [Lasiodiplodia mahajangana]